MCTCSGRDRQSSRFLSCAYRMKRGSHPEGATGIIRPVPIGLQARVLLDQQQAHHGRFRTSTPETAHCRSERRPAMVAGDIQGLNASDQPIDRTSIRIDPVLGDVALSSVACWGNGMRRAHDRLATECFVQVYQKDQTVKYRGSRSWVLTAVRAYPFPGWGQASGRLQSARWYIQEKRPSRSSCALVSPRCR
jgi:hypothetical protein